jgi:hypothetical protein
MTCCYQIIGTWRPDDWKNFEADTYYSLGYSATILEYRNLVGFFFIWVNLDERLDKERFDGWLAEVCGAVELPGVPPGSPRG